jgi:hypothetical protein
MAQVKGSALLARLQFVRERHGVEGLERLLTGLSPEQQRLLRGDLLPHAWAPYQDFIDLCTAIDRLFGQGDLALCYEMGRHAAEQNLPTLYRIFYRLGSPLYIFRKAARVWEVHYDTGRLVPIQEGERQVRIRVLDFERPHRAHCLSIKGWAARSVEMSGAVIDDMKEDRCRVWGDNACEMWLRWR